MSNQSPKAAPSSCQSSHLSIPELAQLAASLQAACDALRSFDEGNVSAPPASEAGETRCYYLSPSVVQHEKELLKKYSVNNFYDLLAEVHKLLIGVVNLMQSTHRDVRLRGYVFISIGALLDQVAALVTRMMNVYSRLERRAG